MNHRLLLPLIAAVTVFAVNENAQAGGVITHGRESVEHDTITHDPCDAECHELRHWVMELYEGQDAMVARRADWLGLELTLEMLDDPEGQGVAADAEAQGGCAATGGSLFATLASLWLLRRRRSRTRLI